MEDVGKEPLEPRQRSLHGQRPQLGFERKTRGGGMWRSVGEVWGWLVVSRAQEARSLPSPHEGQSPVADGSG